jgi:hypothetical protein
LLIRENLSSGHSEESGHYAPLETPASRYGQSSQSSNDVALTQKKEGMARSKAGSSPIPQKREVESKEMLAEIAAEKLNSHRRFVANGFPTEWTKGLVLPLEAQSARSSKRSWSHS